MARATRLRAIFVTVSMLIGAPAAWCLPAGAASDDLFKKGFLNVNFYNVYIGNTTNATTIQNTTDAINLAIKDARDNHVALYFPNESATVRGIYVVNNTLEARTYCYNAPIVIDSGATKVPFSIAMVGDTTGGLRPLIKLAASGTSGFDNSATPKAVVLFRNFDNSGAGTTGYPDNASASLEDSNSGYFQMIRGIDIDCGGHAGAVGLVFNEAQDSSIENVKVTATNAYSGICGLPGRAAGAVNVEVVGGQYGLDTTPYGPQGNTPKANFVSTVVGLKLTNQTVAPIRHSGYPLTIVGFSISLTADVSAITTYKGYGESSTPFNGTYATNNSAMGALCLIDGTIDVGLSYPKPVIDNTAVRNVYLKNVYVKGSSTATASGSLNITSTLPNSGNVYKVVNEYNYCNQVAAGTAQRESYQIIDGGLAVRTPAESSNLATASTAPTDLVTRHIWSQLPSVDDTDYYDPIGTNLTSPADTRFTWDGTNQVYRISAADLNTVIEDHPKIFLRKGVYRVNNTGSGAPVMLKKDSVLFGAGRHLTRVEADWSPSSEVTFITTYSDPSATTYLGDIAIGVPSEPQSIDWFNALDWQAGKNSMVHIARLYHWPVRTSGDIWLTNPHSLVTVSNEGGGRWYFLGRGQAKAMKNDSYRILKVTGTGTNSPLWIYGLNMEHPAPDSSAITYGEFSSARDVRIYGIKTEIDPNSSIARHTTFLSFNNCINVGLFGFGGSREGPNPGYNALSFTGSSSSAANKFLVAHMLPQNGDNYGEGNWGNLISENVNGTTSTSLIWATRVAPSTVTPRSLSLFKRGTLDETTMNHLNVGFGSLPSGWTQQDIGVPGDVGSAFYGAETQTFTLHGAGTDLADTTDEFCFASQSSTTLTSIKAKVSLVDGPVNGSKAGVMIRVGNGDGSKFAHICIQRDGTTVFQYRTTTGGTITNVTIPGSNDTVKLVATRDSSTHYVTGIQAWASPDGGATWPTGSRSSVISYSLNTDLMMFGLTSVGAGSGGLGLATGVFDSVVTN